MNDTTVPDELRARRIANIRQLADWLEANPDLPAPNHLYGGHQMADPGFRDGISAAEGLARVRAFAAKHGVKADESGRDRTKASVSFGIAEYSLLTWHKNGRPGQLDEREAELERLRAEVAALRSNVGLDYSREADDPTPVSPARGGAPHVGAVVDGGQLVDETKSEPVTVYFSFGHGQYDPDTHEHLLDKYVTIVGPSHEACREAMFASRYGHRWSFDYPAGTPTAEKWIPRWTEHERIMLAEPRCTPACDAQLMPDAPTGLARSWHSDDCPVAVHHAVQDGVTDCGTAVVDLPPAHGYGDRDTADCKACLTANQLRETTKAR